jgi:hypothetical protein
MEKVKLKKPKRLKEKEFRRWLEEIERPDYP